jgi:hypothetical protein
MKKTNLNRGKLFNGNQNLHNNNYLLQLYDLPINIMFTKSHIRKTPHLQITLFAKHLIYKMS